MIEEQTVEQMIEEEVEMLFSGEVADQEDLVEKNVTFSKH
jgi:hypothetical protein